MSDYNNVLKIDDSGKDYILYGPASTPVKDSEGEQTTPEGLRNFLVRLMRNGGIGRASLMHEDELVGDILPIYKTSDGHIYQTTVKKPDERDIELFPWMDKFKDTEHLWTITNVHGDDPFLQSVRDQIDIGKLDSYSISGRALDKKDNKFNNMSGSAVTLCEQGMNPYAKFKVIAKGLKKGESMEEDEHIGETGIEVSEETKKAILTSIEKSLTVQKACEEDETKKVKKMPETTVVQKQPEEEPAPEAPPVEEELQPTEIAAVADQIAAMAEGIAESVEMQKGFRKDLDEFRKELNEVKKTAVPSVGGEAGEGGQTPSTGNAPESATGDEVVKSTVVRKASTEKPCATDIVTQPCTSKDEVIEIPTIDKFQKMVKTPEGSREFWRKLRKDLGEDDFNRRRNITTLRGLPLEGG